MSIGTRLSTPDEHTRTYMQHRLTRSRVRMAVYFFLFRVFIRYLNKQRGFILIKFSHSHFVMIITITVKLFWINNKTRLLKISIRTILPRAFLHNSFSHFIRSHMHIGTYTYIIIYYNMLVHIVHNHKFCYHTRALSKYLNWAEW